MVEKKIQKLKIRLENNEYVLDNTFAIRISASTHLVEIINDDFNLKNMIVLTLKFGLKTEYLKGQTIGSKHLLEVFRNFLIYTTKKHPN